jgi:hypothetical protein
VQKLQGWLIDPSLSLLDAVVVAAAAAAAAIAIAIAIAATTFISVICQHPSLTITTTTMHTVSHQLNLNLHQNQMDLKDPVAPTRFGVPMYLTFSVVAVTVVGAKEITGNDFIGTCDPYAVVELVDSDTLLPVDGNRTHHHRTVTVNRSTAPAWQSKVKWRYVSQRFEQLSVKVTLFDEDVFSRDDPLGMVVLPLLEVERRILTPNDVQSPTKKWLKGIGAVKVGVQMGANPAPSPPANPFLRGSSLQAKNLEAPEEEKESRSSQKSIKEQQSNTAKPTNGGNKEGFGEEGAKEAFLERHHDDPERDVRYANRLAMDKDASKEESGSVETWYDLTPCVGGPAKVTGRIRLRTWAQRSDGDHGEPVVVKRPVNRRASSFQNLSIASQQQRQQKETPKEKPKDSSTRSPPPSPKKQLTKEQTASSSIGSSQDSSAAK